MNSVHRRVAVVIKEAFSLSDRNTQRLVHLLARHFPTLALAPSNQKIDGEKMRTARKRRKMSMLKLAKKLDIGMSQVANIEKGRSGTTRQRLADIAEALNVGIEDISG